MQKTILVDKNATVNPVDVSISAKGFLSILATDRKNLKADTTVNYVKFLTFRTQEHCSDSLKIQTKRPNLNAICQKHANGIANSEDHDQTAPEKQSNLGLYCLSRHVCPKI